MVRVNWRLGAFVVGFLLLALTRWFNGATLLNTGAGFPRRGHHFEVREKHSCGVSEKLSKNVSSLCVNDTVLPSLFLVGTNKAGTTNLFWTLMETFPGLRAGGGSEEQGLANLSTLSVSVVEETFPWTWKEKLFWTRNYVKGMTWYVKQYPKCEFADPCHGGTLKECADHCLNISSSTAQCVEACAVNCGIRRQHTTSVHQRIGFDASAEMLYWSETPLRLSQVYGPFLKSLRFIVLLRDPLETFHAHIYMRISQGDRQNFSTIARHELAAATPRSPCGKTLAPNGTWDNLPCNREAVFSLTHAAHARMLEHWLLFVDPWQFLLIFSDPFFAAPREGLVEISRLLDLPGCMKDAKDVSSATSRKSRRNNFGLHKALCDEDPSVVAAAMRFLAPLVYSLQQLLERHSGPNGFQVVGRQVWMMNYTVSVSK